jgi:hypothetical protein
MWEYPPYLLSRSLESDGPAGFVFFSVDTLIESYHVGV